MNVNLTLTKVYRKNDVFAVRINKPNTKPISSKAKMNINLYVTKDYENETTFRLQKNKPKQSQFQTGPFCRYVIRQMTIFGKESPYAQQTI